MIEKNPIPQGKYIPAKKSKNFIFSAGMAPRIDGKLMLEGQVKNTEDISIYKEAVVQAAKNALTAIKNALSPEEKIEDIVTMTVYVNAEDGFTSHSKIADFASEYIVDKLGDLAICSRAAIGVKSLPGNAPVEVQIVASYS
jgi:enamine deaminase RidA (YjgF/YER057c/UK114 family)